MGCLVFALCLTTIPINAIFQALWVEITLTFQDLSEMLPCSGAILPTPSTQVGSPSASLCLSLFVSLSLNGAMATSCLSLKVFLTFCLLLSLLIEKTLFSLDLPWMWKNILVIFCTPRNPSPPCIWSILWLPGTSF